MTKRKQPQYECDYCGEWATEKLQNDIWICPQCSDALVSFDVLEYELARRGVFTVAPPLYPVIVNPRVQSLPRLL
jgi:hypothetical protein